MELLDLTLPTPEENLACDEALLEQCENNHGEEILRFWEPEQYFIVLGYSNKIKSNVNTDRCNNSHTRILRRISGGGTVLQGPGCLNYSLILRITGNPALATIQKTNRRILEANKRVLESLLYQEILIQGHTDLTKDNIKFSGNAQSRKKSFVLFHGTFLLDFNLEKIEQILPVPKIQPDYRRNRKHQDFLMNLKLPQNQLKEALRKEWGAKNPFGEVPMEKIDALVKTKYSQPTWNEKF